MNAGAERFTEKQEASKANGHNPPRPRVAGQGGPGRVL